MIHPGLLAGVFMAPILQIRLRRIIAAPGLPKDPTTTQPSIDFFTQRGRKVFINLRKTSHLGEYTKLAAEATKDTTLGTGDDLDVKMRHAGTFDHEDMPVFNEATIRSIWSGQARELMYVIFRLVPAFRGILSQPEASHVDDAFKLLFRILLSIEWKTMATLPAHELIFLIVTLVKLAGPKRRPVRMSYDINAQVYVLHSPRTKVALPKHVGHAFAQVIRYLATKQTPRIIMCNGTEYLIVERSQASSSLQVHVSLYDSVFHAGAGPASSRTRTRAFSLLGAIMVLLHREILESSGEETETSEERDEIRQSIGDVQRREGLSFDI